VYLCKRTMQNKTRLELADYEAENLARLQKMFSRKWEFIFMQAEAQAKYLETLKNRLDRRNVKISKVADSYVSYFEQYQEYDPFITNPEPSNPWISDSVEFWELEKQTKDIPARRVRRWAFSLQELLKDPAGREQFFKFLEKEFSAENLKFWDAVQELKQVHSKDVPVKVREIWNEYLDSDANCPINIDSKSYEITKRNMETPDRWTFNEAAAHLYQLMKNDSYPRYLRSEMYKEYLNGMKKKTSVKGIRSVISFSAKKEQTSS
ncbi:regulator of G-protein signaling 7-like, partial [Centruroides sculpturatus]|uniref:regulator of G-protein signaling 7-like n=1 Tax=Centruroides sculpturatus TaxID=218467 RepID=UPI000C6D9311